MAPLLRCRVIVRPELPWAATEGITRIACDICAFSAQDSGVGSGVGWLCSSVRRPALRCTGEMHGRRVNTNDFRGAAFWCGTLPSGLPGF